MFLQTKYDTSSKREIVKLSPLTVLLVLTISIFISHFVVMFYRIHRQHSYPFFEMLVESIILTIVISPSLYFLVFRPLLKQINEREEAKEELEKNEDEFRNLVQTMNEGLVVQDEDGKISFVNNRFCKMLGFDSEEIIGHRFSEFMTEENYILLQTKLKKLNQVHHISSETEWKRKDNNKIFTLVSPSTIINQQGGLNGYFLVVTDITSRKRLETELIAAKEKAQESDKMKSEFIAQMSHEIRTPLNTIMSFSKMIKEDPENKISEEFGNEVDAIDVASKRIIRSIELILNLSEIESGNYSYNPEPFDVYEDVLSNLYEEYKNIAARKGLILKLEKTAHDSIITTDKHGVAQIFSNLIDNAIKFTERGSVEIKIYDDPKNGLTVSIIDTGIGISEHFVRELFKPFTQEDHGYTRKFDGMGLGLTLVERYCKINKAKIEVSSVVSKGSAFTVTFSE